MLTAVKHYHLTVTDPLLLHTAWAGELTGSADLNSWQDQCDVSAKDEGQCHRDRCSHFHKFP